MIRMLIVGYCYGIRSERRLTQEVELHLAYRWFCKLDLETRFRITRPSRLALAFTGPAFAGDVSRCEE